MSNSQQDLPSDVVAALKFGSRIEAIKRLRERSGLELKEAKERVDAYLAQTPANSTSAAGCVPADRRRSKEEWLASQRLPPSVIEELARGHKVEAIKLLRASHGLGLKEAKEWVDAYQQGHPGQPVAEPRGSAASGFWWFLVLLAAALLAYALLRPGGKGAQSAVSKFSYKQASCSLIDAPERQTEHCTISTGATTHAAPTATRPS